MVCASPSSEQRPAIVLFLIEEEKELHEGFDNDTALTAGLVVNLGFSRQTGFSSANIPLLIN